MKGLIQQYEHNENLYKSTIFKSSEELMLQINENKSQNLRMQTLIEDQIFYKKIIFAGFSCFPIIEENTKYFAKTNDEIDQKINEFLKINPGFPVKIIRIREGKYEFGSKKINIENINNSLWVETDKGLLSFSDFIVQSTFQEIRIKIEEEEKKFNSELSSEELINKNSINNENKNATKQNICISKSKNSPSSTRTKIERKK